MADPRRNVGLIGRFDRPGELLVAARCVRDAGFKKWDCHTPFPIHGLDEAMGIKTSRLAFFALCAGGTGAVLAMLMQWWMSAVDYPVRVGGKPFFSWPAFVPITFELFVLFSALATTALGILMCGLLRWHSPLHDSGVMAEIASRRFGVVLRFDDPKYNEASARELLARAGCRDLRTLFEDGQ